MYIISTQTYMQTYDILVISYLGFDDGMVIASNRLYETELLIHN